VFVVFFGGGGGACDRNFLVYFLGSEHFGRTLFRVDKKSADDN